MSLIKMLRDGPDVSLSGSPMVSPITAALWASDPLGPRALAWSDAPASIYFLALSHAPPLFEADMAICTPDTSAPASVRTPKKVPASSGASSTSAPGGIISLSDASVEILTQCA
uniref:Uncharacterized protein n=1 Tax=Arundo donax TaxID=35708 RepID=A0A0A8ZLK9_ARUDO